MAVIGSWARPHEPWNRSGVREIKDPAWKKAVDSLLEGWIKEPPIRPTGKESSGFGPPDDIDWDAPSTTKLHGMEADHAWLDEAADLPGDWADALSYVPTTAAPQVDPEPNTDPRFGSW